MLEEIEGREVGNRAATIIFPLVFSVRNQRNVEKKDRFRWFLT